MRLITKYSFLIIFFAACSSQKKIVQPDTTVMDNLRKHISYLADDRLEGRRAGSPGEKLAMEYIAANFKQSGLLPKGTQEYFQPFEIYEGKKMDSSTALSVNGMTLSPGKDFFVFPFSANQKIQATPAIAIQEADMPWFYDLKETLNDNKNNPHFDLGEYVYINAKKAQDKGASAIILFNSTSTEDKLSFNSKDRNSPLRIPVIYVSRDVANKYFKDVSASLDINLVSQIGEVKRTGHNVIAYIDNGAAHTVILGAHFDHLGYGEDGNSRQTKTERQIHNGADDNASGPAALLELGRQLKTSSAKNNNYLFIAFSGEELGLFGSKYFTEHPTVELSKVTAMINMDMVGRLNDSSHVLTIGGYGTSPVWSELINQQTYALPYPGTKTSSSHLAIRIDSSGTGPSDHTSFYRKDIPVLFYFTGLHTDYHKPTDDADKINYHGEKMVIQHIINVVESLNERGKLAFVKTREAQTTTSASFKVTMGIMPDYTYSGAGVRADGVTDGRPASKAGIRTGDIIIQLGDNSITTMESYMQALGRFKKGDKTTVKYKRGAQSLEGVVEF